MSARVLDGKALAGEILASLKPRVEIFRKSRGRPPCLVALTHSWSASEFSYLRSRRRAAAECGIAFSQSHLSMRLEDAPTLKEALTVVGHFSRDAAVDAVIIEAPLPAGWGTAVLEALDPASDAEGVTPENFGRLMQAKTYDEALDGVVPCTALAVSVLIQHAAVDPGGRRAVVIGRSTILGRPAAHLLTAMDATVTLCHSKTPDLAALIGESDIVVAALGKPRFIRGDWIKAGAIVIDAGINAVDGGICGDVDFEGASRVASVLSPVPGGVGPVTTAMLMANVVRLAEAGAIKS